MNHLRSPVAVNFEITEFCNAKCRFCGVRSYEETFDFVPPERLFQLIDMLDKAGVLRLNFFGGEPFIYPHIIEALKYSKKCGFLTTAITNALAITPHLAWSIHGYLDSVGVSIHGFETEHDSSIGISGAFAHSEKAMEWIAKEQIPFGINTTVTKQNYEEVPNLARYFIEKHHVSFIALNRFIPNEIIPQSVIHDFSLTPSDLETNLRELRILQDQFPQVKISYAIHFPFCIIKDISLRGLIGTGCGFGQTYCSVDCYGNVKACSYTKKILGNIFQNTLPEIWNTNPVLINYRSGDWLPPRCRSCQDLSTCMCGCKVTREEPFSVDPLLLQ